MSRADSLLWTERCKGSGSAFLQPGAFRAYLKHIGSIVHMGYGSPAFIMPPRGNAKGKHISRGEVLSFMVC